MDGDRLAALLADAIAAEAAADRSKVRAMRRAASEEATLVGALVELAESRHRVAVRTSADRTHRGVIVAVCREAIVMSDEGQPVAIVRTAAITSVRGPQATKRDVTGARDHTVDVSLRSLLANVVDERPQVHVGIRGHATPSVGRLRSVGMDVVTVDLDAGPPGELWMLVPLEAIDEVVLLDL